MRHKLLTSFFFLLACLALALPLLAQDPVSGTWTGDWGPSLYDRNPVTVDLKWDGKVLSGNVNSGTQKVAIQKGSFDAKTSAVHMEADAKRGNQTIHYVIDGKLDKNMMSGSWNHDNRKGDFKITKK